ncbi:hypothetical protein QUF63_00775 [Anaerolineales bacterium HSG25]|nr:hypothetical protein [Anaerolineales bacterium HSG25]
MATYPIKELLHKWEQATITIEMAIGHIGQHLNLLWEEVTQIKQNHIKLTNAHAETQRQQALLRFEVERLLKHNGLSPTPHDAPPKRPRGRPPKKKG